MPAVLDIDRLSMRNRPEGTPLMDQVWDKLLFLHWPVAPELLSAHVPRDLAIDLYDGKAWLGITPFTLRGLRPHGGPEIPGVSAFHELNVRTYVHANGIPGVWFLSLEASKAIPVLAARFFFGLPYRRANIHLRQTGNTIVYSLNRPAGRIPAAEFEATWRIGEALPDPPVDSLEFFLVERYCLYARQRDRLIRVRVCHAPWALQRAELSSLRCTLLASLGLPERATRPFVHYSEHLSVEVWPRERK